jgi:hypothetical protein
MFEQSEQDWEKINYREKHSVMRWIKPIPEDYPKYSNNDTSQLVIHNIDGKYSIDIDTWIWCSKKYHDNVIHCKTGENNPMFGKTCENNPMFGKHHTEESKRKMCEKKSGENHPMFGKHHTEEAKQKMCEKKSGENNSMFGKHHTEEAKQKMRDSYAKRKQESNITE